MFDLPDEIKSLIGEEKFFIDNVGMSDSTVVLFHDKILKIQTISEESENEYRVMEWLQDKLPVPKVLRFERDEKKSYLLMTKVPGEMSCAPNKLNEASGLAISFLEDGSSAFQKLRKSRV